MATDDKSLLRELADKDEIREVLHRYCMAADRGTVEQLMDLFDDPCDLQLVPGERYQGRQATWKWYDDYIKNRMVSLRHLIHNQVIEVRGDEATSRSYFDGVGDQNGVAMVAAGFYEDRLRRTAKGWKFREKIIRLDFVVPLKEGWGGEKFKVTLAR